MEAGIEVEFKGSGINERGIVKSADARVVGLQPGQEVVAVDPRYFRPTEVDLLIGDPGKAQTKLGWKPKYDLSALVKEMVHADIELFEREKILKDAGFKVLNQFE
jgi:GDPmannose 4,6-dehydratase